MNNNNENGGGYFSSLTGIRRAVPVILSALAVFIAVCFMTNGTGILGDGTASVLLGLFGCGAYAIPVFLLLHAFFYPEDYAKGLTVSRSIFSIISVLIVSTVEYTIAFWGSELVFAPVEFYASETAGGFIGSILAFGIVSVLGHVGILILAAAIVAIYITFFFTRGDGAFSRVVIAFVGFIVNILAAIERFVKKMIQTAKDKKAEKLLEEEERRSAELLDDQFFAVDNGMKELKIGELGIHESKSVEAEKESTVLNSSVFHKSAVKEEETKTVSSHLPYSPIDDKVPEEKQKEKRRVNLSYGIESARLSEIEAPREMADKPKEPEKESVESAARTADDSAESVFTKDFDPFDFAFSESAAAKASSKAQPKREARGISEFTTPLSSITEQDIIDREREIENQKRIAAFEERKKQIIARARGESVSEPKAPIYKPESLGSAENMGTGAAIAASASGTTISSGVTAATDKAGESTKTVEFSFSDKPKDHAPTISDSISIVFEKPDYVADEAAEVAAHVAEIIERSVPGYTRSANKSYTYTKVTVNEEPEIIAHETAQTKDAVETAESTVSLEADYTEPAAESTVAFEADYTKPAAESTVAAESDYADAESKAYGAYDFAGEIIEKGSADYFDNADEIVTEPAEISPEEASITKEYGIDDIDTASSLQSDESAAVGGYTEAPASFSGIKVISEYNTFEPEETAEDAAAQFKQFEIPEPTTAASIESEVSSPKEDLKIERTMLQPTPDSAYSSVSSARDARYTVIDENMPVSEDLPTEEAVIEDTIEWAKGSQTALPSDADNKDECADGTTLVFEKEEITAEADDTDDGTEEIFGGNDEAEIFEFIESHDDETFEDGKKFNASEEDEEILADEEITEIPKEEQNPAILEQQKMFPSIFGGAAASDTASSADERDYAVSGSPFDNGQALENAADDVEIYADEAYISDISDEIAKDTSEQEYSEYKEEDEPPFDTDEAESDEDDVPFATPVIAPKKEEKPKQKKPDYSNYQFPPIELLGESEQPSDENVQYEIQENADKLIDTLASFDVTASIKGVDRGPRITRYEVVPAKGVLVRKVLALENDIALNLAAESIRMEAPIPGKSAVGVEIPNKHSSSVRLRELLETEEFKSAKSKTTVCVGKDVAGQPIFADIAKMPHALIAGATGMGKSVCINSLMISMLFKARPDEVKFIMIDPKQVEFTMYNGIPHLLVPIVTDVKQAAGTLMWAVEEMERRYSVFKEACVKNIDAYNEKVQINSEIGDPMHRIVIVIDEFAELIMQVKNPVESLVIRIAQKARAAGIHLIIGTQKPVKEVITGLIKSNIPTKMSCKVLSYKDSILMFDKIGAEKLLDKGDMLVAFSSSPKPMRVQGTFVNDDEVEAIMDHLKQFSDGSNYDESVMDGIKRATDKCTKSSDGDSDGDSDSGSSEGYLNDRQFLDAVEVAVNSGKISTSLLQRRLSIGYGKAAKFIDVMCDMGVVGEPNGQKPRDVLISADEWREKLSRTMID